jgi:hypothetical protein
MFPRLEYYRGVNHAAQRSIPAPRKVFGLFSALVLLSPLAFSQVNNAGSGGHSTSSPSASSSHYTTVPGVPSSTVIHTSPHPPAPPRIPSAPSRPGNGNNGSGNANVYYYPYLYAVPFPYSEGDTAGDSGPASDDADYQGGPTIFDRRGSGAGSYVPPVDNSQSTIEDNRVADAALPDPPTADPQQPPTVLIFKDGHFVEVENYAIVSQTLYDLTPGHPRKIALADLDLSATEKQNDDRGVTFQIPAMAQAN